MRNALSAKAKAATGEAWQLIAAVAGAADPATCKV